ncbi:hemerythrin-like metal-binding protein [Dongia mobilis]|uniref:Hemerythrin-like metal-binding protein n=1 Tax=Dongia mobilis TaxID=578943 RepID=A0A4R6WNN6_9PROT|nr:hemerythrin domain-containing protein [Dongia mobilis]TDQ80570.1 hemerythrin-like metal-binding protein [Dongia mobilis]
MYTLTPAMLTGIAQLDAEHHDLVAAINQLRAAEADGTASDCGKQLRRFRDLLATHFESEEIYLRLLNYPWAGHHADHHGSILTMLDQLQEALLGGERQPGGIAEECYSELLGTVLTMDLRFLNWHQELQSRSR